MIFLSLFIDLTTIENNINIIRNYTNKDIMIVLKNNAYGLGSKEIIKFIKGKVNWVVYNTYDEYLEDRELLHSFKVLILSSVKFNHISYLDNNLHFSINSLEDLQECLNIESMVNLHIQVDTGMNREGIRNIEECKKIINIIKEKPNLNLVGIYTHYSSDIDEYKYYNYQQLLFQKYLSLYPFKYIHSAASSSIHKNIIGNCVRVGLLIYGYGNKYINVVPSLYLSVKIINKFVLKKGEYLGYKQNFVENKDIIIGVLPIGYYNIREIKHVYYQNKKYRIIGENCMNHMYVEIDDKINYLSSLLVLSKNDIIYKEEYNWYTIITSLSTMKKNYIRRSNYDISRIFKTTNQESEKYKFRRRGN